MSKDDALKLALYVLDEVRSETFRLLRNGQKLYAEEKVWNAIFVIKQALAEQPAQQSHCNDCGGFDPECPLAQPAQQQEHVSVMTVLHLKDRTEIGYGPASAGYDLPTGEYKLYTSPPASKPWVGLTDEEIDELDRKNYGFPQPVAWRGPFARAVEAKLKEKNA